MSEIKLKTFKCKYFGKKILILAKLATGNGPKNAQENLVEFLSEFGIRFETCCIS